MKQFQAYSLRDVLAAVSAVRDTAIRQLGEASERTTQSLRLAGFNAFAPVSLSTNSDGEGVAVTLRIALPGFDKSDVKVEMSERAVHVSALNGEKHPLGLTGKVEVSYPLPFPVDAPNTSCELKDGVLTIVLPSIQAVAKAVQVPVR
jgi:HSP20 family molecular chaperone IbpA